MNIFSMINRIKRVFAYYLYTWVAKEMPQSNLKPNMGQKKIRKALIANYLIGIECIGDNVNIEKGATIASTGIKIGNNSGIGVKCKLQPYVTIGNNVMMGPNCFFCTENHQFSDINKPMIQQGYTERKPIVVGDDVWFGYGVVVLPGVNIGRGCVIGAGAVVAKDIPDYAIVVGNPGKIIKFRNQSKTE